MTFKIVRNWHSVLWWTNHGYQLTGLRAMEGGARFYFLEPRA